MPLPHVTPGLAPVPSPSSSAPRRRHGLDELFPRSAGQGSLRHGRGSSAAAAPAVDSAGDVVFAASDRPSSRPPSLVDDDSMAVMQPVGGVGRASGRQHGRSLSSSASPPPRCRCPASSAWPLAPVCVHLQSATSIVPMLPTGAVQSSSSVPGSTVDSSVRAAVSYGSVVDPSACSLASRCCLLGTFLRYELLHVL